MRRLRSLDAERTSTVLVQNASETRLSLVWLDYHGERVHYIDLEPGEQYEQRTYVTHPWVVVAPGGRCVGMFVPVAEGPHRVVLSRPPLTR